MKFGGGIGTFVRRLVPEEVESIHEPPPILQAEMTIACDDFGVAVANPRHDLWLGYALAVALRDEEMAEGVEPRVREPVSPSTAGNFEVSGVRRPLTYEFVRTKFNRETSDRRKTAPV